MKVALDKLINRLLLPNHPFIKDYEIIVDTFRPSLGGSKKIGSEVYRFVYNVTPDKFETSLLDDELYEIARLTESLFKMLGPMHYQKFGGVRFYTDED